MTEAAVAVAVLATILLHYVFSFQRFTLGIARKYSATRPADAPLPRAGGQWGELPAEGGQTPPAPRQDPGRREPGGEATDRLQAEVGRRGRRCQWGSGSALLTPALYVQIADALHFHLAVYNDLHHHC